MSILEISTAVFPTLTLVWKYLQVNLRFHIYSAPHEEWTISIHPSSEDLEVKDRTDEDWFLLMLKEKDLWGRPIPQHLEGKNLQTQISIVCQFSSNCSIKLLPKRVDGCTRNSTNTNGITDGFFSSVFCGDIHRRNFSITNSVSIYWQKHSVGKYRGDPKQNMKNKKKNKLCDDV